MHQSLQKVSQRRCVCYSVFLSDGSEVRSWTASFLLKMCNWSVNTARLNSCDLLIFFFKSGRAGWWREYTHVHLLCFWAGNSVILSWSHGESMRAAVWRVRTCFPSLRIIVTDSNVTRHSVVIKHPLRTVTHWDCRRTDIKPKHFPE